MHGAGTTGSAETSRPSLREWFDGLYVLSPGTGSLAPVACELVAIRRLGLSTGRPGPHDFTVRIVLFVGMKNHAAARHAHRIPHPTFVTTREAPLLIEAGCKWITRFPKKRKKILSAKTPTQNIALETLWKIEFPSHL